MKGYAIIKTGEHGWIDVDEPVAGPLDAICKPNFFKNAYRYHIGISN